jgi:hypothetical protein
MSVVLTGIKQRLECKPYVLGLQTTETPRG